MKKFLPKTHKNPQGFTLVELLIVIAVIAILSAIGFTLFTINAQKVARDAKRRADLSAIAQALEQYKTINGIYPKTKVAFSCDGSWSSFGTLLVDGKYMQSFPSDPINRKFENQYLLSGGPAAAQCYIYHSQNAAGTIFLLGTNLESSGIGSQLGNYQIKNQQ